MLSDIAQKLYYRQVMGPIQIVNDLGSRAIFSVELEESADLLPQCVDPVLTVSSCIQRPLVITARWISNHPCGAAKKQQGSMALQLEPAQGKERHKATNMQTICRWVKTAVKRLTPRI